MVRWSIRQIEAPPVQILLAFLAFLLLVIHCSLNSSLFFFTKNYPGIGSLYIKQGEGPQAEKTEGLASVFKQIWWHPWPQAHQGLQKSVPLHQGPFAIWGMCSSMVRKQLQNLLDLSCGWAVPNVSPRCQDCIFPASFLPPAGLSLCVCRSTDFCMDLWPMAHRQLFCRLPCTGPFWSPHASWKGIPIRQSWCFSYSWNLMPATQPPEPTTGSSAA